MAKKNPAKRKITKNTTFSDYYESWIYLYKEGHVTKVTFEKYLIALDWIRKLLPNTKLKDLDRNTYQDLLNKYGETHEKSTTKDFKDQTARSLQDAFYNGLIDKDPTYSVVIKGQPKKDTGVSKFLNEDELKKLVDSLELNNEISFEWFIYFVIMTGTRYQEALAVTPKDFDYRKGEVSINKAWDYKNDGGFTKTKNKSSVRKIYIGTAVAQQFKPLLDRLPADEPIFANKKVEVSGKNRMITLRHNSPANDALKARCEEIGIPVVTIHSLRHTYASVLLAGGVSMLSVSHQLGHASTTTTSKVYTHQTNRMKETEQKRLNQVFGSK